MKNKTTSRRDFLKTTAKAAVIGAAALSSLDVLKLAASVKDADYFESTAAKVIKLSDYPSLQSTGGYAMISSKVIVIRVSNSKFVALNIVCTHKKCDVEYDGSGFECPCHGSTYNKYGKVTEGPAKKNLKSYKTTYNAEEQTVTINM